MKRLVGMSVALKNLDGENLCVGEEAITPTFLLRRLAERQVAVEAADAEKRYAAAECVWRARTDEALVLEDGQHAALVALTEAAFQPLAVQQHGFFAVVLIGLKRWLTGATECRVEGERIVPADELPEQG